MTDWEIVRFTQEQANMIYRCRDCGEIGRHKKLMDVFDKLSLYCHDEEKSCYNYVLMRQGQLVG